MSFGLGRGRTLDDAPGVIGISAAELPALSDLIAPGADGAAPAAPARVDPRAWFRRAERAFEIEIGSGKGAFLLQEAPGRPDVNFLGIEWAREFYLYTADRVRRRELPNVRVLRADACEFLRWRCAPEVAGVIHLYFSDPWPKARHHKRRVVQDRFLADAWRVLRLGGELRIVTDHDEYWSWMRDHFARWTAPQTWPLLADSARTNGAEAIAGPYEILPFIAPASAAPGELVGTNFERKFRVEGRSFHAAILRKQVFTLA